MGLLSRAAKMIRAYHGSPHDFDKFVLAPSTIGTGEGAQAFGHGLYFAEKEAVAKAYRDNLTTRGLDWAQRALDLTDGDAGKAIALLQDDIAQGRGSQMVRSLKQEALRELAKYKDTGGMSTGRMYEVAIKADPEEFLDWDKPLSQQSRSVQTAWNDIAASHGDEINKDYAFPSLSENPYFKDPYGSTIYRQTPGSDVDAAMSLKDRGVPGIKFLDQGSRGVGAGTRNFVVFDDSLIDILRKYGLPIGATGATGGLLSRVNGSAGDEELRGAYA